MTSVDSSGVVEFRFFRPSAGFVGVAGDFNGWRERGLRMQPAGDGWWTARLPMRAGEYRFRYVADGQSWFTDYASHGVERHQLGWWDSVLVVPESETRTAATLAA